MENETLETNEEYVNEDVSALDEQAAMYEAKIAEKDRKYSALLKAYSRGERAEASAPPELSIDELKEVHNESVKSLYHAGKQDFITNYDEAKKLVEFAETREKLGLSSPFLTMRGTPTQEEIDKANTQYELMKYGIENAVNADDYNRIILAHINN